MATVLFDSKFLTAFPSQIKREQYYDRYEFVDESDQRW